MIGGDGRLMCIAAGYVPLVARSAPREIMGGSGGRLQIGEMQGGRSQRHEPGSSLLLDSDRTILATRTYL